MNSEERKAFLDARRDGIGGSDAAIICSGPMGYEAKYGSLWSVWASKVHGVDNPAGPAAETGHRLEAALCKFAAEETGTILDAEHVSKSYRIGWRKATIDGLLYSQPLATVCGVEAKVRAWPWKELPRTIELQCRWYMSICDMDSWVLSVFFRNTSSWEIIHLTRDLEIEREMIEICRAFWFDLVVPRICPPDEGTIVQSQTLKLRHPRPKKASYADFRRATTDEQHTAQEIIHLEQGLKDMKELKMEKENTLRGAIGDAPGIRWTGGKVHWAGNGALKIKVDA